MICTSWCVTEQYFNVTPVLQMRNILLSSSHFLYWIILNRLGFPFLLAYFGDVSGSHGQRWPPVRGEEAYQPNPRGGLRGELGTLGLECDSSALCRWLSRHKWPPTPSLDQGLHPYPEREHSFKEHGVMGTKQAAWVSGSATFHSHP